MTGGRPTALTADLLQRFREIAEYCASTEEAAAELNIGKSTFHKWISEGATAENDDPKRQFRDIALTGRLIQKNKLLSILYKKAVEDQDVSACKYLLDRVHKLAQIVELSGPNGSPLNHAHSMTGGTDSIDVTKLSTAAIEEIHGALAKAKANKGAKDVSPIQE